jgi:hypothetical protein
MDKKAIRILHDTFWSSAGWGRDPLKNLSAADFEYAKARGVMFDPVGIGHDELIEKTLLAVSKLSRRAVADAFLASLSTRRLDWRSALGSYTVFQHLQPHAHFGSEKQCLICGIYSNDSDFDLNVLNFERHKWGGVRHSSPGYAWLDLTLFLQGSAPQSTAEDRRIFRELIDAIASVPSKVTSAALQSHLGKIIKSNKSERDMLIAMLGYCGILGTPDHPGFSGGFVGFSKRRLPDRHFVDMAYPACWWNGETGINQAMLHEYFGHVM